MKTVRPDITSNEVPYLQVTVIGSHSTFGRMKEKSQEKVRSSVLYNVCIKEKLQTCNFQNHVQSNSAINKSGIQVPFHRLTIKKSITKINRIF